MVQSSFVYNSLAEPRRSVKVRGRAAERVDFFIIQNSAGDVLWLIDLD
jgi:hypothetical protein